MHKEELTNLPDDVLLGIARNPSAVDRKAALRVLVQRGSGHAAHPELLPEARSLILDSPAVLKDANPFVNGTAHKLPGLVDVVTNHIERTRALENLVGDVDHKHSAEQERLFGSLLAFSEQCQSNLDSEAAHRLRDDVILFKLFATRAEGTEDLVGRIISIQERFDKALMGLGIAVGLAGIIAIAGVVLHFVR